MQQPRSLERSVPNRVLFDELQRLYTVQLINSDITVYFDRNKTYEWQCIHFLPLRTVPEETEQNTKY